MCSESSHATRSSLSGLDPVVLALTQSRLDSIALEMGRIMSRTSRSPIFNQSHDFSCFITDAQGSMVSQADGLPIHTGGGGFSVRAILRAFADDIQEDDIFLLNDPYVAGGNHLPDWVIACPVFAAGDFVAFTCIRAHQSDIGGGAAGTYNPAATEIFHEGLRLPPLKLIERGQTRKDLWQLLQTNCRTPELLDGDLRAMIGSTRIGGASVKALSEELDPERTQAYFIGIMNHADKRFRETIKTLPDGQYEAEEIIDNDCFETKDIEIRVLVTISGDQLTIDFTGSHSQIRGFKNSSIANTHSAVYLGLASLFDHDIPRNEGTFRSVTITAPEGSIVNPRPPAAVTMCTVFIAHEIVHCLWKALAPAAPDRACAGWGKSIHCVTSGRVPESQIEPYVMYHWNANPGSGAVKGRDGFNQIGHLVTLGALTLPNAEVYEQIYPLRITRQEFRCDGGGPGIWRGGTGVDYGVEILGDADYSFRAEGLGSSTGWGVNGGGNGAESSMTLYPENGDPVSAPSYGNAHFGPVRMVACSPGGGGWGNPLDRSAELVFKDFRDNLISRHSAETIYGLVLDPSGRSFDQTATSARREELRRTRS